MVTIKEDFILPSKGLMYGKPFDPHVELRSMTVAEEMKRLSNSNSQYKVMCDIIEDCLITKLPVKVYDLYMCDYIFLLHRLRTVTYGANYKTAYVCKECGDIDVFDLDLDSLPVNYFDESLVKEFTVVLPVNGNVVKLKLQTPRDLDRIAAKAKQMQKDFPEMADPAPLLTLRSYIESIDDMPVDDMMILDQLKKLSMRDANVISKRASKLESLVGINVNTTTKCNKCGGEAQAVFRYTSEFFGPEED